MKSLLRSTGTSVALSFIHILARKGGPGGTGQDLSFETKITI